MQVKLRRHFWMGSIGPVKGTNTVRFVTPDEHFVGERGMLAAFPRLFNR